MKNPKRFIEHLFLEYNNLRAYNTLNNQPAIPSNKGKTKVGVVRLGSLIGKVSWNVIRIGIKKNQGGYKI